MSCLSIVKCSRRFAEKGSRISIKKHRWKTGWVETNLLINASMFHVVFLKGLTCLIDILGISEPVLTILKWSSWIKKVKLGQEMLKHLHTSSLYRKGYIRDWCNFRGKSNSSSMLIEKKQSLLWISTAGMGKALAQ